MLPQHTHCLFALANQLFLIIHRSTFEAERAGMIQITARGDGGTNNFRPSRGFHLLAWCPGNALHALPMCVCVCVCAQVRLYKHPRVCLHLGPIMYLNTKPLAAKAAGRAQAVAACKVGCHSRILWACRAQNRLLRSLPGLDQCFAVLVESYECIFNVAEPSPTVPNATGTWCPLFLLLLLTILLSSTVHVKLPSPRPRA
ncbi:hypothetical protein HDV63DRAFT_263513 [Trichoderma sp. SZMC 28014]